MEYNKKKTVISSIVILLMFLTQGGGTYENAAVQATISAWPDVAASSIRMMITLPSVVSMIAMLLVGNVVGKKISYRAVSAAGLICSVIGMVPCFFHPTWGTVLAFRVFLGIATGCFCIRNPLLVKTVPPQELAKYIGWGGVINNLLNVIINPVVGAMAEKNWSYAFYSNIILVVVGVLAVAFLVEPAAEKAAASAGTAQTAGQKSAIPGKVIVYMILQFLITVSLYPLLTGMSTFVVERGYGNAVVAGSLISVYMVSGIVLNLLLPIVQKVCKSFTLAVAFAISGVGAAGVLFLPNFIAIAVCVFITGVGFMIVFSMFQVYNGLACKPDRVAFCSTLILAANQLAIFASSYFITLSHRIFHRATEIESSFLGCVIVCLVLAVLTFIFKGKLIPAAPEES